MILFHTATQITEWDSFGLAITRYLLAGTSLWSALVAWRMLRRRPLQERQVAIIPRPVLWFAFGWSLSLALFVFTIAAVDADPVSTGWGRTFYATAIVWAQFGMTWIVALGSRTATAAIDVVTALDKAVQEANKRAADDS